MCSLVAFRFSEHATNYGGPSGSRLKARRHGDEAHWQMEQLDDKSVGLMEKVSD